MNEEGKNMERKKWLAAAMGMTMPGMGQIYNGELVRGISFFAIFLVLFASGFRWTVLLPDRLLIAGAVATIITAVAAYVLTVIDAYRKAKYPEAGYELKSYNRWYVYLAFWLIGSIAASGSVYDYVKNNFIQAYKIVTLSMAPDVLKGDRVLVDKTAYRRMAPKKGDIVIFVFPDDRSKVLIRRVEGLPGDVITLSNGKKEQVPHGTIYVLADKKEESIDSRELGAVPLRDVIGKARQVYYSSGDEGVRWNRVGTTLGS